MFFPLGHVVGDVVDHAHLGGLAEKTLEGAAGEVGDALAVGPGEVGGGGHGAQVVAALGGVDRDAGQLPVGQLDVVAAHGLAHLLEVVGADLVAEAARAGVDEHDDLPFNQAHSFSRFGMEDALDVLDFQEVVAGAERGQLRGAALLGALRAGVGTSAGHDAFLFGKDEVFAATGAALLHHPTRAAREHGVEFLD